MEATFTSHAIKDEYGKLDNYLNNIITDITTGPPHSDDKQLLSALNWVEKVCRYNVPHGKKLRGLLVPLTVRSFIKNPSNVKMDQAYVLGWCVEILQAACLVTDDIMDKGKSRRGRPCWYLVDGLGPEAFNDALLLEHIVYQLLRKHFGNTSYYLNLVELFLQVTQKTVMGQCLDTQMGRSLRFEEYTMEKYEAIVKYKTSYYTFYLPIALATTISDLKNETVIKKLEDFTMNIGHMFQVTDDFLDCYGSEQELGKVGTDIENGKCSWLFVQAKELCSKDQLSILYGNYGQDNHVKVAKIKELYERLDMPNHFKKFMKEHTQTILEAIKCVENEDVKMLMHQLLDMISKKH